MTRRYPKLFPLIFIVWPFGAYADFGPATEDANEQIEQDEQKTERMLGKSVEERYNALIDDANAASKAADAAPTRPGKLNRLFDAIAGQAASANSRAILDKSKIDTEKGQSEKK